MSININKLSGPSTVELFLEGQLSGFNIYKNDQFTIGKIITFFDSSRFVISRCRNLSSDQMIDGENIKTYLRDDLLEISQGYVKEINRIAWTILLRNIKNQFLIYTGSTDHIAIVFKRALKPETFVEKIEVMSKDCPLLFEGWQDLLGNEIC